MDPSAVKPEFPKIDQDKAVSPHAQEIEYALILSKMINSVKDDPAQMRSMVYEFARARLKIEASWAERSERNRLLGALETAIEGVEAFSVRREDKERLPDFSGHPGEAIAGPSSTDLTTVSALTPAQRDVVLPSRAYRHPEVQTVVEIRTRTLASTLAPYCIGALLLGALAGVVYYREAIPLLREALNSAPAAPTVAKPIVQPSIEVAGQQGQAAGGARDASAVSPALPFPVPSDYGVYALHNGALSELSRLPEQVPDKRIAVSTPVNQPSRTTISDGKARFILFRRDLVGNAPERIDVRVVARIVRVLAFDSKGKPSLSPVSDAWNIRNQSYEFRVRPIPGNPEMLMVQPENPDFILPAGRYVLALRDQGYDFTVAGEVTDLAHCLERTDAANGAFYSQCQKL
jgi:hypothetical protein